jgi:hypothetical protein
MCPTPPIASFELFANNEGLPRDIREAAAAEIQLASSQIAAVSKARSTDDKPSTGHTNFTCTLYSLNNKMFPALVAEMEKKKLSEIEDDIKAGKRNPAAFTSLPGDVIQKNSEVFPTKNYAPNADGSYSEDMVRQKVYDNYKTVWAFYKTCFGRNSLDNKGLEMRATLHLGRGFANAFWDYDSQAMYFGDGGRPDGRGWLGDTPVSMADPMQIVVTIEMRSNLKNWHSVESLDVIAHELTHGVVSFEAALGTELKRKAENASGDEAKKLAIAANEAKTVNEHVADCFAIMCKHWANKPQQNAEEGDWDVCPNHWTQVAMDSWLHKWNKSYMRTFRTFVTEAEKDAQPDQGPKKMDEMKKPFDENTDPHANMGIPNHAFYLAALAFSRETKEPTWKNVGLIWYKALTDPAMKEHSRQTFKGWRDLTIVWADKLFNKDGQGKRILTDAWKAVGL